MTISQARSEQLTAKYDLAAKPKAKNPIVRAIDDGEKIVAKTWLSGTDCSALFDPSRSPEMWALAQAAHHEFRMGLAAGEIEPITWKGNMVNPDSPDEPATLVWWVGDSRVFTCRRKADNFGIQLFRISALEGAANYCTVGIAESCGGQARHMPLLFGSVLLVFNACERCRDRAGLIADDGYTISMIEAYESLGLVPPPRP